MIMQGKIHGLAAVLGLAVPLAAACGSSGEDARGAQTPVAESVASAEGPLAPPPPEAAVDAVDEPLAPPPVRVAEEIVEPPPDASPAPPIDLEPLVVIGPRDGETLGEYRARADRLFNRLDNDADGRLSREEIISAPGRVRLRHALHGADIDLDEHVSRPEFNDLVTRAYQELDGDGNGVITEAEMEAGDPMAAE